MGGQSMKKAFNIDRPTLMIRSLDQRQIDGIRKILADNPEHGSLIPNLNGTVWFKGCGCDFLTKDGTVVSADIQLITDAGITRLEIVSCTENYSYFHVDSLTDIVGDHVIHYYGEDFTIRVPDPAEEDAHE